MSPERYQRIRQVLDKRQTDLTVCLENVHKPHNVSAVVRTCDAVGIHRVHTVWEEKYQFRRGTAMGSQQWVRQTNHENIGDAMGALKGQGMQVLVTHLSDTAVDFRDVDYTKPTAILFGQEKYGATDEAMLAVHFAVKHIMYACTRCCHRLHSAGRLADIMDCTRFWFRCFGLELEAAKLREGFRSQKYAPGADMRQRGKHVNAKIKEIFLFAF